MMGYATAYAAGNRRRAPAAAPQAAAGAPLNLGPNYGGSANMMPTSNVFDPSQYFNAYNQAYNEAKQANLQRYGDISKGYDDRYNTVTKDLEGAGAQALSDTRNDWNARAATGSQSLIGAGLGGTTVMPTMAAGYERQKQDALNRVNEGLRQQRIGVDSSLLGDKLKFQENRDDTYPDLNTYANLAMAMGKGGMGQPMAGNSMAGGYGAYGAGGMGMGGMGGMGGPAAAPKPPATQNDYQQYVNSFYKANLGTTSAGGQPMTWYQFQQKNGGGML